MKEFKMKPEGIIVPGELDVGNETILKIYHRIYQNNKGNFLPPVIVTQIKDLDKYKYWLEQTYQHWEHTPGLRERVDEEVFNVRRFDYEQLFYRLRKFPYVLLDGNHRTTAAALTKRKVKCLELETNEDLEELISKIDNGEIFEFKREETDLEKLKREFIAWCLSLNIYSNGNVCMMSSMKSCLRYTETVGKRIEDLIAQNGLPGYMIENYKQLTPKTNPNNENAEDMRGIA